MSGSAGFADEDGVMSEINVTPLVDVVLVLLIVFMITVPAIVASAPIKLNLPETSASPLVRSAPATPLEIFVRQEPIGDVVAYVGQQRVIIPDLRRTLQAMPLPDRNDMVQVAADKGLPYGEVMRVLDIVSSLGFKKVSLNTRHVEPAP